MFPHDDPVRRLIAEEASEWYVAQSEGALSPRQARAFMRWLRTSPVHVAEYLTIAGIANEVADAARHSTAAAPPSPADPDSAVLRMEPGVPAVDTFRSLSPRAHRARAPRASGPFRARRWPPVPRLALVIAILAAAVVVSLAGWQRRVAQPHVETFITRHGETRELRLPDHTHAQLDADSEIAVHFDRTRRRVVLKRGQAYFRVTDDPRRPFSVRVDGSLIRDIGTAFDVYRHASNVTITVAKGHVELWTIGPRRSGGKRRLRWLRFHPDAGGQPVADLRAGQQVQVTNTGQVTSLGDVDVSRVLAWRHGRIAFDDASIRSVAAEFNRYNTVQIRVADPGLAATPISGVFDAHDTAAFVAFLDGLPGVRAEANGPRIVVRARPPRSSHHR